MPGWLKDAVFYEIYPQSFQDANGDGIGDFQGIIDRLDYIRDLGCNAIWMNPCFDSPFRDAGYDVRDYKKTAERYGSIEDLMRLFDAVHARDMHILLDLVPGHTSEEHPWFLESGRAEENEYSGRYIWTDGWLNRPEGLGCVAGKRERNGVYIVNFFATQPALNYGFLHPEEPWQQAMDAPDCLATREAIKDIMTFWLSAGCDGFRVDMADSLVKNDDAEKSGTCAVWRDIISSVRKKFPEMALVSEWNHPTSALSAGFDMDFFLDWQGNGYNLLVRDDKNNNCYFKQDGSRSVMDFFAGYLPQYDKIREKGSYCLLSGNHDTTRISHYLTERELRLFYGFLFTMPGNPFLYYGDEIGMRYLDLPTKEGGYTRTGSRSPMQWDKSENLGFSTAQAADLYLPVDAAADAPTVEAQEQDANSLLSMVKEIIALRHRESDLQDNADFHLAYVSENGRVFAYARGSLLMACNPDTAPAALDVSEILERNLQEKPLFSVGETSCGGGIVHLGSQAFAVYRMV